MKNPHTLLLLLLSNFSRVRLCDPMASGQSGSSVHEIFQARRMEWVTISSSRVSSQYQESNLRLPCLLHCGWILYPLSHQGSPHWRSFGLSDSAEWAHCHRSFFSTRPPQECEPAAYGKEPLSVPYFSFVQVRLHLMMMAFSGEGEGVHWGCLSAKSHAETSASGSWHSSAHWAPVEDFLLVPLWTQQHLACRPQSSCLKHATKEDTARKNHHASSQTWQRIENSGVLKRHGSGTTPLFCHFQ